MITKAVHVARHVAKNLPSLNYRSNTSKFASYSEFLKWKWESLQTLPNLLPLGAEGLAGLLDLPNLPFSEFESQSNTNSESTNSTVSRIDTNQTQPKSSFHRKSPIFLGKNNDESSVIAESYWSYRLQNNVVLDLIINISMTVNAF